MRVPINYLILSLYFFVYVTPAYINGIFLAYDKVFPQMFIVSLLNIFSFIYIFKKFNLKDYILSFEYKNHYLAYLSVIVISIISKKEERFKRLKKNSKITKELFIKIIKSQTSDLAR